VEIVKAKSPVESICMPGPGKLARAENELKDRWEAAGSVLRGARRLVIIGYSFPPSDTEALGFFLRNCGAEYVEIVLGPGAPGHAVEEMTRRHLSDSVQNTKMWSQQYLTEGTVGDFFSHEPFWGRGVYATQNR
jgi:hypothetical protein